MRAAVYQRFGGPEVVRIEEVPKPVPKAGEVLIRVRATTVSVADHRMRARDLPRGFGLIAPLAIGIFGPRKKVLGMDFAGTIEAVGDGVTRFRPGDDVVGLPQFDFGGHADYLVLSADAAIAPMPAGLSFADAAALPFGGQTALTFLRRGGVKPGDAVLVNGASGSVGNAAVQIAKAMGATVTGVTSARNAELVRSLGADQVIDYGREDFAAGTAQYDVIVECVGNAPFSRVDRVLKPGGALLLIIADFGGVVGAGLRPRRNGKRVIGGEANPKAEEIAYLLQLQQAGKLRPLIDRQYPFEEIVEAHRYVDTGRKRGNVVLVL